MYILNSGRGNVLTRCALAMLILGALSLPPVERSAAAGNQLQAQSQSPGKMMQMRSLTTADIMKKVRRRQTTPIGQKLSPGEVGSVNTEEVKCYKKRSGGLVQVKCPDLIVVDTK